MLVRETGEAVSKWDCYPLEMFLKLVVLLLEWSLQFTLLAGGKKKLFYQRRKITSILETPERQRR